MIRNRNNNRSNESTDSFSTNPSSNSSSYPSTNTSFSDSESYDRNDLSTPEPTTIEHINVNQTRLETLLDSRDFVSLKDCIKLLTNGADANTRGLNGYTLLHIAAIPDESTYTTEERIIAIDRLIELGATVDAIDDTGKTPLQLAMGELEFVSRELQFSPELAMALVHAGANPNQSVGGESLLNRMITANHMLEYTHCIIELINSYGADTNNIKSPIACFINGEWDFSLKHLLKIVRSIGSRINLNVKGDLGRTILHKLIESFDNGDQFDYANAIDELVSRHGVSVDSVDDAYISPLQLLLSLDAKPSFFFYEGRFFSPHIAMALVRAGANPNQSFHGKSLLDRMMEHNVNGDYKHFIEELIQKFRADPAQMKTPLQCIIDGDWNFSAKRVLNLIKQGEPADTKGRNGETLLHKLVSVYDQKEEKENEILIQKLIHSYGASVDMTNDAGLTPLQVLIDFSLPFDEDYHFASVLSPTIAMILVRAGANPNLLSRNGESLLNRLMSVNYDGQYDSMIDELIKVHGADPRKMKPALFYMINGEWSFSLKRAMNYVRKGAPVGTKNVIGNTLLHCIATNETVDDVSQHVKALQELIGVHGAVVDEKNDDGQTPLQIFLNSSARTKEFCPIIGMTLVRLGANPNQRFNGYSLLDRLVAANHDGKYTDFIIELVDKHHADVNARNWSGFTLLEEMINSNERFDSRTAMTLVRLGAKFDYITLYHKIAANDGPNSRALCELEKIAAGPKSEVLMSLYVLINAWFNPNNSPLELRSLPRDILLHILSIFITSKIDYTYSQGYSLAKKILSNHDTIKTMAKTPGGINVLQSTHQKTKQLIFTLYKSCERFAEDYEAYRERLMKENVPEADIKVKLHAYRAKAMEYWNNHVALFQKPMNKQTLLNRIKDKPAFADVKHQLKI